MRSPTLSPSQRVVWITGASSGIGANLARAFAAAGASLVLSGRNLARLVALQQELDGRHSGQDVAVVPLDMTRPASFPAAVQRVRERFGRLHILVHNAGISQRAGLLQTDPEDERRVMETNFFGPANLTRAAAPLMLETEGPTQLVVISSVAGMVGTPLRTAYSASKFALGGWFEAAEVELYDQDLGVTMVFPGFVRTRIAHDAVGGSGADPEIEQGMDPDAVARQVLRGVIRRERRIVIAGKEGLAPWLRLLAPSLLLRKLRSRLPAPAPV